MGSKKTCSNAIDNKSSINSCPPSSCKEIIRTDDLWPSSYRQIIRVKASRFVHLFFGSIRLLSLKKRSQKKREVSIPILKVQKYFQFHDKPTSNLFNLWGFDTFIRVSCQQLDFVIRGSWLLYFSLYTQSHYKSNEILMYHTVSFLCDQLFFLRFAVNKQLLLLFCPITEPFIYTEKCATVGGRKGAGVIWITGKTKLSFHVLTVEK